MMRFCQATTPGQRKLSPPSNPIFLDFTPPTPATTNLAITTTQSSNSQIPKCAESSTPCGNPYLPSLQFLPSLYIVNTQTNPPKKKPAIPSVLVQVCPIQHVACAAATHIPAEDLLPAKVGGEGGGAAVPRGAPDKPAMAEHLPPHDEGERADAERAASYRQR